MNKLLVTGLALGKDFDGCQVCNFDMQWLLKYSSILVWADKIFIPKGIWTFASSGQFPFAKERPELSKCTKLMFEMAKSEGIIEVFDPKDIISQSISDNIEKQIEKDRIQLSKLFSNNISLGDDEKVPGQIFIGGTEYCSPRIWTIYASLLLAKTLDAHCLFDNDLLDFCKYKFGLSGYPSKVDSGRIESFHSIFEAYIPNEDIFPEYIHTKKDLCLKCEHENSCKDTYLSVLEKNIKNIFTLRDYDEIQQVKSVIKAIVDKRNKSNGIIDAIDIKKEFQETQNKLRRRIKLVFPKIKRWSNITTTVSVPVALAGAATGLPLLTVTGASLIGLSQAANMTTEYLSSKYSWSGFTTKDTELQSE